MTANWAGAIIPALIFPTCTDPEYIRINSQGYRDNQDFSPKVPAGKFRVGCSGDSFTFGYGVSNDETWRQVLESHDPRLQTVSMGEGGYGVDQMYLRYQRDLDRLDLDVHLVAAINADFDRMLSDKFNGYNKPVLKLDHGRLVAGNTPVPKGILQARLVAVSQQLDQIRSIAAVRRIIQKFHPAAAGGSGDPAVIQLKQVLSSMLDSFRDLDRSRNRILVFVYLPTLGEATGAEQYWRPWIEAAARARGIAVIDLLPDFQALPASQAGDMFIREGSMKFIGARGHFTAAGNKFAADKIYSRLLSMPEIKRRLDSVSAK